MQLDSLPVELIHRIVLDISCTDALALLRVNRRLHDILDDSVLFAKLADTLYLDVSSAPWPDFRAISRRLSTAEARKLALAVQKVTTLDTDLDFGDIILWPGVSTASGAKEDEEDDLAAKESLAAELCTWLPHLVAMRHPCVYHLDARLILQLLLHLFSRPSSSYQWASDPDPPAALLFCVATALIAQLPPPEDPAEQTDLFPVLEGTLSECLPQPRSAPLRPDDDDGRIQVPLFFAYSVLARMTCAMNREGRDTHHRLRGESLDRASAASSQQLQQHLDPEWAPLLVSPPPTSLAHLPFTTTSACSATDPDAAGFCPFGTSPATVLRAQQRSLATEDFLCNGDEWTGFYSYMGGVRGGRRGVIHGFEKPMENIYFERDDDKQQHEARYGNFDSKQGHKVFGVRAVDCRDGVDHFSLSGTVAEDGFVRMYKSYHGFGWTWYGWITPFGIVGTWGRARRGFFSGYFWIWKRKWAALEA